MPDFDLIIIGGGPAGYVAAIRAAQLGLKTACVERDRLGGVCLNWGCIPTKALLANAEFYHKLNHHADDWGITADNVSFQWDKVIGRSRTVADQLNKGVAGLFKKNKITHFQAHAHLTAPRHVHLYPTDDPLMKGEPTHKLTCTNTLIATGAKPRELPGSPFDEDKIISSKQAMTLEQRPDKLLIIGAGAIGMEFAYFYQAYGTQVTVVEMVDRVLPVEDADVSQAVAKAFKKLGVQIHTGHKTVKVEKTDTGIRATIAPVADPAQASPPDPKQKSYSGASDTKRRDLSRSSSSAETVIDADKLLVAIGVRGRFDGLFTQDLGIELFKDHIKVDMHNYQTNVEHIYAVGDVIGPPWLAHVASEEAVVCVEQIAGHHPTPIDYEAIPGCTYCHPQIASIGRTEARCKQDNLDYTTATFPFLASGKAQAMGETTGFCKMITGKKHGEILGVHMVGENVTELIAEIGLAMRLEATADEIIATIHAHPTLSESIHEAALGTQGHMIHF